MVYANKLVAVVKCGGKILREQKLGSDPVVYLPFGSEYSLLLKNKEARRAQVGVEIDGQDVLNGNQLVIDSNSEMELERFLENMNKGNRFKFIKKIQEIVDHRGDRIDDGMIRISYQFEKQPEIHDYSHHHHILHGHYHDHHHFDPFFRSIGYGIKYGDSGILNNKGMESNFFCSTNIGEPSGDPVLCTEEWSDTLENKPAVDEGVTVKGSISHQKFGTTYVGELEPQIHTIVLLLKGCTSSTKVVAAPITVKTKLVCTSCGKKSGSENQFCSRCGTSLI